MIDRDELRSWLDTLPPGSQVAVDDGGLTLELVGSDGEVYIEVGGLPVELGGGL
jgi:hypothetical protein